MVTVATFSKPEEAHLARAHLECSGIEAWLKDELTVSTYWLYSNAIGGVKVQVNEADVARARELLALPPSDPGMVVCPHCGSSNTHLRELGFWSALFIGASFVLPFPSRKVDCLSCKQSFDLRPFKNKND